MKRVILLFMPFVISITTFGLTAFLIYYNNYQNNLLRFIVPDLVAFFPNPLPYTTSYVHDAEVLTTNYVSGETGGFLHMTFQLICSKEDPRELCTAGLIFGNLSGSTISQDWTGLSFKIRGARGNEVVGLQLKEHGDAGFSRTVRNIGEYTSESHLVGGGYDWQQAFIPRQSELGGLDLSNVEIMTFFVDANDTEDAIIEVDIQEIRVTY